MMHGGPGRGHATTRENEMTTTTLNEIINKIAAESRGIDTLDTRKADSLDFLEIAVWNIREALEAAFEAGAKSR